jgi:hypothetical protein
MKARDYLVGYGRPPISSRFAKGRSGNLKGRPPMRPLTWAQVVEQEWMKAISISERGNLKNYPALFLILSSLQNAAAHGSRKAHRVFRKYETVLRKKLLLACGSSDRASREKNPANTIRHPKFTPAPSAPLSEKDQQYRAWQKCVEELLPRGLSARDISQKKIRELMRLVKKTPDLPTSRDIKRRRPKKMRDTEIFDAVTNGHVTVARGDRHISVPRMQGAIMLLVAKAARGAIDSAEVLIDLHRQSTKHGDFGMPKLPPI